MGAPGRQRQPTAAPLGTSHPAHPGTWGTGCASVAAQLQHTCRYQCHTAPCRQPHVEVQARICKVAFLAHTPHSTGTQPLPNLTWRSCSRRVQPAPAPQRCCCCRCRWAQLLAGRKGTLNRRWALLAPCPCRRRLLMHRQPWVLRLARPQRRAVCPAGPAGAAGCPPAER